jgi:HCOMODA/2-hydroxy-3-carboxy-muconic semialdehyde decarboxylase
VGPCEDQHREASTLKASTVQASTVQAAQPRGKERAVIPAPQDRDQVAEAARVLSALGLVTAYGHVSARAGTAMLITPAADLATVTGSTLVEVPLTAAALPPGAPAEAWAHLALYRTRSDAGAIARAQPPAAFAAAAAANAALLPLHGQAAWLGASVPVHDSALLLRSAELAGSAADRLPEGEALLLRGNGALTLGATPGIAVARMWLLSAACDTFLATRAGGPVAGLSAQEIASWRAVQDELLPRLWQHLRRRTLERP